MSEPDNYTKSMYVRFEELTDNRCSYEEKNGSLYLIVVKIVSSCSNYHLTVDESSPHLLDSSILSPSVPCVTTQVGDLVGQDCTYGIVGIV